MHQVDSLIALRLGALGATMIPTMIWLLFNISKVQRFVVEDTRRSRLGFLGGWATAYADSGLFVIGALLAALGGVGMGVVLVVQGASFQSDSAMYGNLDYYLRVATAPAILALALFTIRAFFRRRLLSPLTWLLLACFVASVLGILAYDLHLSYDSHPLIIYNAFIALTIAAAFFPRRSGSHA
jgi:hypothetical protein